MYRFPPFFYVPSMFQIKRSSCIGLNHSPVRLACKCTNLSFRSHREWMGVFYNCTKAVPSVKKLIFRDLYLLSFEDGVT